MFNRVPRRYWLVITSLIALAFFVVGAVTLRVWLGPWQPVVALMFLGLAPMLFWAFLGAFVLDPTRTRKAIVGEGAPSLRDRFKLSLLPILICAVPFVALACTWSLASTRIAMVKFAASNLLTDGVAEALVDSHPEVRLAACESLRLGGAQSVRIQLAARLADPDERVVDCALNSMLSGGSDPAMVVLAASAWAYELMSREDLPAERACQLAARVRTSEKLGVDSAPLALLQCSLGAATPQGRECCAQSFRAFVGPAAPSMVLPLPAEIVRTNMLPYVPDLVDAAFSDDPNVERQRQQLRLTGPGEQAWTLAVACEGLSQGASSRHPVSSAVARAVSGSECSLGPASETTVRLWTATCSEVFASENRPADVPAALCKGINRAMVADAANQGQRHVTQAVREAANPDARREMLERLLDYSLNGRRTSPNRANTARMNSNRTVGGSVLELLLSGSRSDPAIMNQFDPSQIPEPPPAVNPFTPPDPQNP